MLKMVCYAVAALMLATQALAGTQDGPDPFAGLTEDPSPINQIKAGSWRISNVMLDSSECEGTTDAQAVQQCIQHDANQPAGGILFAADCTTVYIGRGARYNRLTCTWYAPGVPYNPYSPVPCILCN